MNSLAFRLFASAVIWTAVVLPVAGLVVHSIYAYEAQEDFDTDLKRYLYLILAESTARGDQQPDLPKNVGESLFEMNQSGWYWQIRPVEPQSGIMLVSGSLATGRITPASGRDLEPDEEGIVWRNATAPNGQPIRVAEMRYRLGTNETGPMYSFLVAGPLNWLDARVARFTTILAGAFAAAGMLLLGMTFLHIHFGLLPLRQVRRGLQSIRTGDSEKLEGELPAEIQPLQQELNALIRSNQEIIDRARTQVGNLAHALKTPLAVITNAADETDGVFGRKVAEQAQVMRDQINHYLDRARIAARTGTIGRLTEVAPVVTSLQRTLERIYRDRHIVITTDLPDGLMFHGEKHDLEEMLGNLLDNACKWADRNVYLSAREIREPSGQKASAGLLVAIEDDGPGLSRDQRKQLGKRGVRLDETKPGSGLGLSIVSDLACSYRGNLRLEDSEHGGLRAIIYLPASSPAA